MVYEKKKYGTTSIFIYKTLFPVDNYTYFKKNIYIKYLMHI